jgi:hypothetical protein
MAPDEQSNRQAWEQALDLLEAVTYQAQAQLRTFQPADADAWTEPTLTGPLPADLEDRARRLLALQQQVIEQVPTAMERVRQQRSVTERFTQATSRTRGPVYVDRTA